MDDKASAILKQNYFSLSEGVVFIDNNNMYLCNLALANYTLHFLIQPDREKSSSTEEKPRLELIYNKKYFSVPIFAISKIKRNEQEITIRTKDNRRLSFRVNNKSVIYDILSAVAFPENKQTYLAFALEYYQETKNTYRKNGWFLYDVQIEFIRQRVDFEAFAIYSNVDFKLCETYPIALLVPLGFKPENVIEVASLRSIKRLPVMTYYHKETKCGIWRCSQRKKKFFGSSMEKQYFKAMNKFGKSIRIYDARTYLNAVANSFKGGQIEKMDDYDDCEIFFCDIDNIHAVKSALKKCYLLAITNTNNKKFFSQLEQSLWYDYISSIIKSSCDIANSVVEGITVLVHCSDGWDRTTQLCATAQLLLDGFYRTIEGFCILIEKDWVSFGHQFSKRNGTDAKVDRSQQSPIFVQWLDVVQQIMKQYPSAFEFRTNMLCLIAQEVYTCKYGTFLFNNDQEREYYQAQHKTASIWSEILLNKNNWLNPYYNKNHDLILKPQYFIQNLHFWRDYFFKFFANYSRPFNEIIVNQEKVLAEMISVLKQHGLLSKLDVHTQKFILDKDI